MLFVEADFGLATRVSRDLRGDVSRETRRVVDLEGSSSSNQVHWTNALCSTHHRRKSRQARRHQVGFDKTASLDCAPAIKRRFSDGTLTFTPDASREEPGASFEA